MSNEKFIKYAREKSGEQLCINESVLLNPPIKLHSHDFIELSYVCKGHATHIVNDKRFFIGEGDLFLLANSCEHTFENGSTDFNWINILFLPQLFEASCTICNCLKELFQLPFFNGKIDFRAEKAVPYIHLYKTDKSFKNLFRDVLQEYYNAKTGYITICKNILEVLLIRIARQYIQSTFSSDKKTNKQELIDTVYDYFKPSSSFNKILREDIALRLNIHPDSLSRVFKKEVGINLSDFIRDIRLQYAACYLLTTTMNVNDIIQYVGYHDTKNFYKAFKQNYHLTPAQYRKKYKDTIDLGQFDKTFDLRNLPC